MKVTSQPSELTTYPGAVKVGQKQAQLLVPLSVCFNSQAATLMFSVLSVFAIQLFNVLIHCTTVVLSTRRQVELPESNQNKPELIN